MVAEPYGRRRMQGPVIDVLRIELQQSLELLDRFGVLVAVEEHAGVVAAQFDVIRRHFERRRQQDLGVVEHLARDADAREQTHGLDVIAMAQQERANLLFRGAELAIAEERRRRNDFRRCRLQLLDVCGGPLALLLVTDHLVESLEQAPGGGQRRVDLHCALVGFDRARRILEHDVAVTALLVEKARARVMALQLLQGSERVRGPMRVPQPERQQVQDIPVLGIRPAQGRSGVHRLGEVPLLEQSANPMDLGLDSTGRQRRRRHTHGGT